MQALSGDDPRQIGRYTVLNRLGSGGMGEVYLAKSPGQRLVAIKTIHREYVSNREFRVRFAREVAAARQVSGAFTAPVLDADPDAPIPWLATAYIPGPTLESAIAQHGPLPETSVRILGAGLAEALLDIHGCGLVHRDLKPTNVVLAADGPRVLDFGIVHAADGLGITATGATIGTPGYWSPEQVAGRSLDARSDVFSLGALLVFAASGTAPFGEGPALVLLRRVAEQEPDLSRVPAGLRSELAHCLAKDPARRPSVEWLLNLSRNVPPQPNWLPFEILMSGTAAVSQHDAPRPEDYPPTVVPDAPVAAGPPPNPPVPPEPWPDSPARPEPWPNPPAPAGPQPYPQDPYQFSPESGLAPAGAPLGITPEYVRDKRFKLRRGGYHVDDVDEFLDLVEQTFRALLSGHHAQNLLTATEVKEAGFRTSVLRPGYAEAEVDDFLDEIIAELRRYGRD